ncbi:MAG TPA: TonB-dependent receptor [Acidobacteriota bacterium]|nr:TonB-dependent receptor [Acidobacteriota bacterium]
MNRSRPTAVLFIILLLILLSATAQAQILATRLEGMIQKASGAPISDAAITATDDRTGWQTKAQPDSTGRFVYPALPPGSYTITVEAKDYRTISRSSILLGVSGSIEENFIMEPGDATETINEEAPRERISKADSLIAGTFLRHDLEVLPQLQRTPILFSALQPGVLIQGGNPGFSRVNGTGQGSNNVTLDGIDANDAVNPRLGLSMTENNTDSIQQINVVTSLAPAEYGRNAGAQVLLTTLPGRNRWSGNAFEYFRDKAVNANDFFNNANKIATPHFTQHLYGGSFGGPLIKDRTLIFANYEGRRTTQDMVSNQIVLTPTAKSGLFQWYAPASNALSSFSIVQNDPRKLGIDPKVAAVLKQLPDPINTSVGDGLNTGGYQFNNPIDSNADQGTFRVDHQLTERNRVFLRGSYARSSGIDSLNGAQAAYPGQPAGTDDERHWGVSFGSEWTVSPMMVNELRAGYQSAKIDLNRPARVAGPMFIFNSWSNLQDPSFTQSHDSPVAEFTDHFAIIRGKHALKAGVTFRYTRQQSDSAAGTFPDVTFGLGFGNLPPSSVGPSAGNVISATDRQTFNYLYNNLLGRMEQVGQTFYSNLSSFLPSGTSRTRAFSFYEYGIFVQDDWKFRPNLTLNLGIRYEINGAPSESDGVFGALDKAAGVSTSANIANFTLQPGTRWYNTDLKDFAPRAGFSWAPRNSSKMVVRGGYGIYYDRVVGAATNLVDNNTPSTSQVVTLFPNSGGKDVRLSDGVPLPSPPGTPILTLPDTRSSSVAIFTPDLRVPYVQQFNLGVQRQMPFSTIVEAGYVGQRGKKLFMNLNLNQPKIQGGFLQAFQELQNFRAHGTPVSSTNTLLRIFGSVGAAVNAIGGSTLDSGQAGLAADAVDRNYFGQYAAAGVSDFYLRNFPQYNQFFVGTNSGSSSFDSLQVNVRRNSGPLKVYATYMWSKSFDNVSSVCSECATPSDSFNLVRAPSDSDRKRIVNAWLTWSMPFGKDASPFGKFFVADWDMGLFTVWETGPRFSVSSGLQTATPGINSLADYSDTHKIGAIDEQTGGVFWFTPAQIRLFTIPAPGGTGTSGRNSFVGPGYFNIDISLMKTFVIRAERRINFRIEAYNVLNHSNFGVPDMNLSDTTFGQITSMQGHPRQFQAALRYQF